MSSTYPIGLNAALYMGTQALSSHQQAIETIGNNVSNVNTPGYARERVNLVNTSITYSNGAETGTGVAVQSVEGLRSNLLDGLVQQSLGDQGYADNAASLTSTVQDSLGEQLSSTSTSSTSGSSVASGSGAVQDAMTNFFDAFQTLSATPSDSTARSIVVTDGQTLSTAINSAYQRLQSTQSGIAADASTVTTQINQLSQSIASLNEQITEAQAASGGTANDLVDTRTADIESLSSLVNVTTSAQSNGSVNVVLADNPAVSLVNGVNSNGAGTTQSLSVTYDATASTPLTVSGSTTGSLGAGVPSGGSLGADLDVANNVIGSPAADGDSGLLGSLDGVANQISSLVNTQNEAGFDLNGTAGTAFFSGTGAADLAVSSSMVNNPSLIAAGNGSGPLDGSNALAMANIQSNAGVLPAFQTMVSTLGQTVSTAQSNQTTQDAVTKQYQTQRDSVSGVSIDEEMTNLINFQQAYDASARFITTISDLYNTLVNNTGTG
jgi:flagellar hook-associated protein 1